MTNHSQESVEKGLVLHESGAFYVVTRPQLDEDSILAAAEAIIERRFRRQGALSSASDAKRFLRAKLVTQPREQFGCLFIDQRFQVIAWEVLFTGTLACCPVYTREVVQRALDHHSAAVILAHQHPSGDPEPSVADGQITRTIRAALALFEIQLLDHIVIGAHHDVSMAERGLL